MPAPSRTGPPCASPRARGPSADFLRATQTGGADKSAGAEMSAVCTDRRALIGTAPQTGERDRRQLRHDRCAALDRSRACKRGREVDLRRPARRRSTLRRPTGGADLRNGLGRRASERCQNLAHCPQLACRPAKGTGGGSGGLRAALSAPAPISRQNDAARPGGRRRQEPLNRSFLIPSDLIFDSNVEPGMPSFAAAPDGPDTRPLLAARAASIISLSRATSSPASG